MSPPRGIRSENVVTDVAEHNFQRITGERVNPGHSGAQAVVAGGVCSRPVITGVDGTLVTVKPVELVHHPVGDNQRNAMLSTRTAIL